MHGGAPVRQTGAQPWAQKSSAAMAQCKLCSFVHAIYSYIYICDLDMHLYLYIERVYVNVMQ